MTKYFINDNQKAHTFTVYKVEPGLEDKLLQRLSRLATFTLRNKNGAVREEVGKLVEEMNKLVVLGRIGQPAFPPELRA